MSNYLESECEFMGLNLGLNSLIQCDTMCNNSNQSTFFSKETSASHCVVMSNVVEDLVTARNLNYHFKALESQVLSRAYFLRRPFRGPLENLRIFSNISFDYFRGNFS